MSATYESGCVYDLTMAFGLGSGTTGVMFGLLDGSLANPTAFEASQVRLGTVGNRARLSETRVPCLTMAASTDGDGELGGQRSLDGCHGDAGHQRAQPPAGREASGLWAASNRIRSVNCVTNLTRADKG